LPKQSIAAAAMAKLQPTAATAAPKMFTQPPAPKPPENAVTVEKPSMTTASETVNAAFVLNAPQARQVSICGDFNDWKPQATPMKRQEGGRWGATLVLRPGRYQYKFVADGQWMHDPNARENVPNEHGSLNSVIEIRV
jgi:1,4-alpha-glucan branching enzyme